MTNYQRGVEKERHLVDRLLECGALWAYRTAGSHSRFDVIGLSQDSIVLAQVKRTKQRDAEPYLSGHECLKLQRLWLELDASFQPLVKLTWAVWVNRIGWYEYVLARQNEQLVWVGSGNAKGTYAVQDDGTVINLDAALLEG